MTNKEFSISVNKFFYYIHNYNCVEITDNAGNKVYVPNFFMAFEDWVRGHIYSKYKSYLNDGLNPEFAIIKLYGELDGSNRYKMLSYINEHYKQSDDFGISIED